MLIVVAYKILGFNKKTVVALILRILQFQLLTRPQFPYSIPESSTTPLVSAADIT